MGVWIMNLPWSRLKIESIAPALAAMELAQMVVQGLWGTENALLQIPHVDKHTLERCKEHGVELESVFDVLGLDDAVREKVLDVEPRQMAEVADFCNDYPNIELAFDVTDPTAIVSGDAVALVVTLEREVDDDMREIGKVKAPRYPAMKKEGWWLVVADVKKNLLLSIKRLSVQKQLQIQLDFVAPAEVRRPTRVSRLKYWSDVSYLGRDRRVF